MGEQVKPKLKIKVSSALQEWISDFPELLIPRDSVQQAEEATFLSPGVSGGEPMAHVHPSCPK